MGGYMTCCHRNFTKKSEEGKKKKVIQFMVNIPMFANWVQIEITKNFF
jgi:hypothetical protein